MGTKNVSESKQNSRGGGGGGVALHIKVMGVPTLRLLSTAVQQLKMQ